MAYELDDDAGAIPGILPEHFSMRQRSPPPMLRGLVSRISIYREHGGGIIRQTETASLDIPLVIGFDDPFRIALGRQPGEEEHFTSFTAGLYGGPVHIRSSGTAHCLQVNFMPLGAYRFFGLPMRELTARMVVMDDLADAGLRDLRQRLGEEGDWDRRFAIVESFLVERMTRSRPTSATVEQAFGRILASSGRVPVERLAGELGCSRKHLAQRFGEEIGLAPKAVARIVRFNRAQSLAVGGRETGWADIAAASGYADQAHMVREFSELAGATPSAWLASVA